jgi:signal transduction histidine kinase
VDIPPGLAPILADHARLMQVFANLVGNAVHATPPGGLVCIRAESTDREICFHVVDTGSGIDPDTLPHIFERFFQGSRGKAGSGLGLTISRGLVEAQGGRMWAVSRPGEGSTFSFAIPLEL